MAVSRTSHLNRSFVILVLAGLLAGGCSTRARIDDDAQGPTGGINNDNVPKLKKFNVGDALDVKFFIAGDVHFQSDYSYDAAHACWGFTDDKLPLHTAMAKDINDHCTDCVGGVIVGDLMRVPEGSYHFDDTLRTYRAIFEHDNPNGVRKDCCGRCNNCKTPGGQYGQVRLPVFLGLGNHDDPSAGYAQESHQYVRDRIRDSEALYTANFGEQGTSSYYAGKGSDMYAWEWGNFHFIWLGIWAFYGSYDEDAKVTRGEVSWAKVDWLKAHLKAIGKDKAIVLFQHFGWDKMSLGEDWWSTDNVDLLSDVICDRQVKVGESGKCDNPYNVIALFSGHVHQSHLYHHPCARGSHDKDSWTSCPETLPFANLAVDDGYGDGASGYYRAHLRVDQSGAGKLTVDRVSFGWQDGTVTRDDCVEYQDHSRDYNPGSDWPYEKTFTTSFIRFAQGEPNDQDGTEDCAEVREDGRFNDNSCATKRPVLCKNAAGSDWKLTSSTHGWRQGFAACRALGPSYEFAEPTNLAEQRAVIDLMHASKTSRAWVNYTDLLEEGKWGEGAWVLGAFDDGEPNNGTGRFERMDGENCAVRRSNGKLNDVNCATYLTDILCRCDGSAPGWYAFYAPEGLSWYQGKDYCAARGCKFKFPGHIDEFNALTTDSSRPHWVSLHDLDQERQWVDIEPPYSIPNPFDPIPWMIPGVPWILFDTGWQGNEPDDGLGKGEDCALMGGDGAWHDVACDTGTATARFACRDDETGEWKRSATVSASWADGFEACRQLGINSYFAFPFNSDENAKAMKAAAGEPVWLNYTDAAREGAFQYGFWLNWAKGEPNDGNGDEDCAIIKPASGQWNDLKCSTSGAYTKWVCRKANGDWVLSGNFASWDDQDRCGTAALPTYPTCPSENAAIHQLMGQLDEGWISFNDKNVEGHFQPWELKQ